jgi:hypothetical protein
MFMERTDGKGNPSEKPTDYLIPELSDGIVRESLFVERDQPPSLHSSEEMEEDDDFLSVGSEVWEYDIHEGRDEEFVDALKNSQMVLDYEVIDDGTDPEE